VSAGSEHTCGRTNQRATYCWGSNWVGEIGATTGELVNPSPVEVMVRPLELTAISAGAASSCGLLNTGLPLCWGGGESSPRPFLEGEVLSVSTGEFICSLRQGGIATCRDNEDGQPYQIQGPEFTSLSVGGIACGLAAHGAAWCWQKGSSVAELVPGGLTFTSITAGGAHACGVQSDGIAFCWGQNERGQLGDRTTISRAVPDSVGDFHRWTQLSAGREHTCGVATDGEAYCWGAAGFGQLGYNAAPPSGGYLNSPVRVRSAALPADVQWSSVTAGYEHSCGVTVEGLAFCWGNNTNGQLGNGTTLASMGPVAVGGDQ
jgi:alpha-tubulin suppressor-like RCC1 family protein